MTIRPHDDYERFAGMSVAPELPVSRWCASCHALARDRHHCFREINGVRRPEVVKDMHTGVVFHNVMPLCRHCHTDLTGGVGGHKAQLYYDSEVNDAEPAWLWIATATREVLFEIPVAVLSEGVEGGSALEATVASRAPSESAVEEGKDCPTCHRRVPHKHKQTSPKTVKQLNLGPAPTETVEELRVRLDDLAAHWGIKGKPYHRVKVIDMALELVQHVDPELVLEIATKRPWAA